ncbi:hypothetical protein GM668_29520 [Duganella ginsengisoli]|uniref:Uncharacterized protein n=2 Tax=Pseudoduganella ginsengisoli TaxID=1462440 RepID=A0A6L6QAG1_9BURK|nr:hypothetical protein [Pseudoduganella ginsengisoli]
MSHPASQAGKPLQRPASAECRTLLADGRIATITASRRPRGGRADVKCVAPGAAAVAARMQQVVRLARHTEARFDSREQVVLSLDATPADGDRGWELAAVLADRMVRGLWQPPAAVVAACGWSDAWHQGTAITGDGSTVAALARALPDALIASGVAKEFTALPAVVAVPHLGVLSGHTDPCALVSSARAWFPLYSGGAHDTLAWVEVAVTPLPIEAQGTDEEETIAAPGLNVAAQLAVRQVLAAARHFDGRALGRWRTVVRFSETRFQGNSYELALVMADRLARGREFVPRGRLIATGCSAAWHTGRVDPVQELAAKLALIARQGRTGDRILLPEGNIAVNDADITSVAAAIREQGATVARIARIGMI